MIVLDTSVIFALLDAGDDRHQTVRDWYQTVDQELVTTPLVLAEADHLTATRAGARALATFRADVRAGAYRVEWWSTAAKESAIVADRYADIGIGLTDASLVALCARMRTLDLATLDERHFRVVRPLHADAAFRLLPMDRAYSPE